MATIYKYILALRDVQQVNMPDNAVILSSGEQHGNICIWAKIPVDDPRAGGSIRVMQSRTILMYGTGHPLPERDDFNFIGTVQLQSGELVLHIFEVRYALHI